MFLSTLKYNKAIKERPQRAVVWTRKDTRALYSGVGMTPHVKINVQIPADCTARAFFFFN